MLGQVEIGVHGRLRHREVTGVPYRPSKKPRRHFEKSSTIGVMLGPVGLPAPDDQWLMSFHAKKQMYGEMRSAVGGATEDQGPRQPNPAKLEQKTVKFEPSLSPA